MIELFSESVFLPDELTPRAATLSIADGRIKRISNGRTQDARDLSKAWILPGLVDTHVHINEPGRTDWEGFETATRAAIAGGITTLVDMPLNCIPATVDTDAFQQKLRAAQKQCHVDFGFWGGVIPGNADELAKLVESGVMGFKAFMIESGVDEFPMSDTQTLTQAMKILARAKVPLLVHAEVGVDAVEAGADYASYLASRPERMECEAISRIIELSGKTGCHVHIVHLSSAQGADLIRKAKKSNARVTAETCPHYLSLCSEEIGAGETQFKCAPPIRPRANAELLWEALLDGTIDMVVSDHSPCHPSLKKDHFAKSWGGISGLQFGLSLMLTEIKKRKILPGWIVRWMCQAPARLAGLKKGEIRVGGDADLCVVDANAQFEIRKQDVQFRHAVSPYLGRSVFGKVEQTYLGGSLAGEKPGGRWLRRNS